ncbi:adenosine/AMP deaminase [Maridesulfovibrio salexigens]|uniref:adenosine deaminase n=1 Tax=Maridesulfovibrio salexigens (strain ATCC 14822 / DSM 2638 / NCIMB 8403 / VKM B-1763) TaxID=526222 RepID=C6C0Z4_MARSD|nr:adenosine/AMP deaminase [Maridesulfovibrio salexigens]ACS81091.1 adenosine/AMP deaminase [Maridesulfovibrio salexigens DSM 2638]
MKKLFLILLIMLSACVPKTPERAIFLKPVDPVALRMILAEMPKGAELHSHLSGIPYAEDYLRWAADDGACIVESSGRIVSGPCKNGTVAAKDAYKRSDVWGRAVNSLSVREGVRDNRMWGHDRFFATFSRFGAAKRDKGRLLAHAVQQAERDGVQYIEVMMSIYGPQWISPWAAEVEWDGKPEECFARLKQAGLFKDMDSARKELDRTESRQHELVGSGPGSDVKVRYINQIFRGAEPAEVFAQMAWSFELVRRDSRVVGLNMVGPEDNPVAMRDYVLHMNMLDFFHSKYPDVPIALHAGELTPTLATPKGISNHIKLAVIKGHARRIGHGVALAYEDTPLKTIELMKKKGTALEVLLGSNDVILNVSGIDHPLTFYLKEDVPVVLASDDMGIARSTLTDEYVRAVLDQNMTYKQLKEAARNSLEYSFLNGGSLWVDKVYSRMVDACSGGVETKNECKKFLSGSPKAALQWNLEKDFKTFEDKYPYLN